METTRLRLIRQPAPVGALLESFVQSLHVVPHGAHKVSDFSELPGPLLRLAVNAENNDQTWDAWAEGLRVWFFTAEMSLPLSRERGRPVLNVDAYGEDGDLIESALWLAAREGEWRRDAFAVANRPCGRHE